MAFLTEAANRGSISTGYDVSNSVKLEADNQEEFIRTPSAASNQKTWTVSMWFKRTELNNYQMLFGCLDTYCYFDTSNNLTINFRGAGTNFFLITNRLFRDTYAWYHIVVVCDATNSTAADRGRLYINGVRETSFSNNTYENMDSNDSTTWNSGSAMAVGGQNGSTTFQSCGYMAEVHAVDGSALTAASFGEFDEDSNIWKPKKADVTYGTNGFYFKFDNASDLGEDSSGNNNDFTKVNITAADQATDSPTNNFPILVPMYKPSSSCILSEGGLEWDINMPSGSAFNPNTSAMSSFQVSGTNGGKWYIESKITNNERGFVGIVSSLAYLRQTVDPTEFVYWDFYNGWIASSILSTETNPPGASANDIIGIALDCDNQRVTFSKNGGWLAANGDMTGGSPSDWRWDWTSDANFLDHPNCNGNIAFWCGTQTDANTYRPIHQVNFGGYAPYTISSGNSDANGYGNFEYAVPSGFYALCTKNLAEYG